MKRQMMTAVAVCALAFTAGCAATTTSGEARPLQADGGAQTFTPAPVTATGLRADYPTTVEGATQFVAYAEAKMLTFGEYAARVQWARATNITFDTMWLESKVNAEATELQVQFANQAARFNDVAVDPVVRRKLNLLRLGIVLPAPNRPGAAEELSQITTRLDSTYSTGKFDFKGQPITLDEASLILADSRDPNETKALYEGWRTISPVMKNDYARMVEIANEGARELGFSDTGALWRSGYDMPADDFAEETDRLWAQVKPFYENLHCYVRARLNAKYGDAVQPDHGPIRADLLGNMWSQQWGNIYDVVAPTSGGASSYDLTELLKSADYDPVKMVKTGEGFYVSLGLDPLPQTFWERSQIVRPRDREVVCHASAWDLDNADDIRIKMCTNVNGDDFYTVHHELGHNYYQRAYKNQPMLFRNGANDGFHEAIGDFVGLSALTPTYLNQIGLLKTTPGAQEDIPFLLKMALDKIAFLPFGLMVDRWRWGVFSGETSPDQYNAAWTADMLKYQGLVPPGPRPTNAFDPGAKYHVPGNTPYTRYFLAHIYQFQFQRAACKQAGWTGPLHRCSVYGNEAVGARFNAMLEMGQSKPWPEAMQAFTGETANDASAVADYFAPLNQWLTVQNRGHDCGWSEA
ncbi:MAG: M2 family metallopeptidase [Phenylobacterium sp.]|jgi:peptidyl-dipeptidase A|uniref:M2 family metallopeptidase n=1 Tax=Brevundimonas mediterranea TaxID=74329 RepID=A0AB37E6M8_9CAUL|nr:MULTISPECIES: M2 family metallopeptidase [Brevundimonas]MDZ4055093.1 M2 family metallopeptidase [Phenylobacterium sp.]OYX80847.1 MAG: peptidyl-dipeptidase [Brevundimonas sp. 32-68-21]EDX79901.1 dipeptidyl carboxydipeptidase family [Brevundimonas sp. BAL3]MBA4333304.1 peptidase M2 family protein [Brevundimonas sp.]MDZ4374079.1 M2 family metallopeptidase [Phenylobacterium sp.]